MLNEFTEKNLRGPAVVLLALFFVVIIIPLLIAHEIADWAYPVPHPQPGGGDLRVLMDKRSALGWLIFLGIMALLGICLWLAA